MKLKTNRNLLICFFILVILICGSLGFIFATNTNVSAEESANQPITMKQYKSGTILSNNGITNERVLITITNNNYTKLYYKTPQDSDYSFTIYKKYVSGIENGWYHFYATTEEGYSSAEYSFYYDSVKPCGTIYCNGTIVENDSFIKDNFSYEAIDSESGVAEIYYKTPLSDSYLLYSAGSIIPSNAGDGLYYFYAIDNAGNEDTDLYFCPNDILKISFSTSSGNVTSNYQLDTKIMLDSEFTENDYTITLTNAIGTTTSYTYHIVRSKPFVVIDGQTYSDADTVYFNSDKTAYFVCDSAIKNVGETGVTVTSVGDLNLNEHISYASDISKMLTTSFDTETKYILYLNDMAGNESTITVFIDKCVPNGVWDVNGTELIDGGYTNKSLSFNFIEDGVMAIYSFNGSEYEPYTSGHIFSDDGTYRVVLTDTANNKSYFTAHIDTVAPTGQLYANSLPVDSGTLTKECIYFTWNGEFTATVNGKPYTKNSTLFEDAKYTFVLTDFAGNTVEYVITIKTTLPTISLNGISDGGKGNTTVTITDLSEPGTVEVYRDGELIEYNLGDELKEYGSYEVKVRDELGNERTYSFVLEYEMNGGAIVLIVIGISLVVGIVIAIIFGKKAVYTRKFSKANKLTDDELFEIELNAPADENTDDDSNAE